MPLPDFVKSLVDKRLIAYCDKRVPAHMRNKITVSFEVRGNSVTIFENRAPWRPEFIEWTKMKVAQIRYDAKSAMWTLYCSDRNEKWHEYQSIPTKKNLDKILEEIDADPTGIFWG
jgi:hypothetical protein